jgi:hypothetical protein
MTTSWQASGQFPVPKGTWVTFHVAQVDDKVDVSITVEDSEVIREVVTGEWSRDVQVNSMVDAAFVLDNSSGTFHGLIEAWPRNKQGNKFFSCYPNGWDLWAQDADWTGLFKFTAQ